MTTANSIYRLFLIGMEMVIQWGHFKGREGVNKKKKKCYDSDQPIFEMPPLYYISDESPQPFCQVIASKAPTQILLVFTVMPFYLTSGAGG